MRATFPSPNFGVRRGGARPELIVLHYTGMPTCAAARDRLCDPASEVSAHWLIAENGSAEQLVDEEMRAWHAGAGAWRGVGDVNSRSIGIELANPGDAPFAHAQMAALERLLGETMDRWAIPPDCVIAHSDMAPDRKGDPGPRFDWRRLALAGLSVWPEPSDQAPAESFLPAARRFGYTGGEARNVLDAFRLRFRPWASGPQDPVDAALATNLAARFGQPALASALQPGLS